MEAVLNVSKLFDPIWIGNLTSSYRPAITHTLFCSSLHLLVHVRLLLLLLESQFSHYYQTTCRQDVLEHSDRPSSL